ncbi:MAG: acyl carrier protein [Nanoarchaeota archaeon]|nr:acyl carrier protein [Nanoarchaeota archaeon]
METLRQLVSRVLSVGPETLSDASSPDTIPSWDSFNALMLVSELEANFSVTFSLDEVTTVKCFGDIKTALRRHQVREGLE